jgi:hypothetical protein
MIRPELHGPRHSAAVAPRPERPRFDAVAWRAAREEQARMMEAVAAPLQKPEPGAPAPGTPAHAQRKP